MMERNSPVVPYSFRCLPVLASLIRSGGTANAQDFGGFSGFAPGHGPLYYLAIVAVSAASSRQ